MKLLYERKEALALFTKMCKEHFEGYDVLGVEYTDQHEFIVEVRNKVTPSLSKLSDYQPTDADQALGES